MRPEPYIGISGIMSRKEIAAIDCAITHRRHRIAFGVLVSAKTVRGVRNKYPNRYPHINDVAGLFVPWRQTDLVTLHYSADNDLTLVDDVELVMSTLDHVPAALQINMGDKATNTTSPHPSKVATIAAAYPQMRIILQLGLYTPSDVHLALARIARYAFAITDVLIDGSCGNGRNVFQHEENVDNARMLLLAIRNTYPHLGIGIAGGQSADTLQFIADLLQEIPDLSIDAEGRLRDADDHLDVSEAVRYALAAIGMVT